MTQEFRFINEYIQGVKKSLRLDPFLARRVCAEIYDHLLTRTEHYIAQGNNPEDAEQLAIRDMGESKQWVFQYTKYSLMIRFLLNLSSAVQVLVALWLLSVLIFVLPGHNDNQIPFWTLVLIGYLALAAFTFAILRTNITHWIRVVGVAIGIHALGIGIFAIWSELSSANQGKDFEGYIVLMGLALSGHGILLLCSLLRRQHTTTSVAHHS